MISPGPVPERDLKATQEALPSADHEQRASTPTLIENTPPSSGTDWDDGLSVTVQVGAGRGIASCEMLTVVPPTSIFPDRADPSFALTT